MDLIDNNTLTAEAAAILLLAINSRLNITITGGPGTGKTTLLNALDKATPKFWRKIYIEDAIESRILEDHHQVRLQVEPIDEYQQRFNKSEEIVKCLHRSPDYMILGEIQTIEHTKALFQAVAAGLRSIQTCHSASAPSLISRWIMNHGIEQASLGLMDLIVTLERPRPGESIRQVKEIVEIQKDVQEGLLSFVGINVIYDNQSGKIHQWAENGAFCNLANELRTSNIEKALKSLIQILKNHDSISLDNIGERLWSSGHPINFTS